MNKRIRKKHAKQAREQAEKYFGSPVHLQQLSKPLFDPDTFMRAAYKLGLYS